MGGQLTQTKQVTGSNGMGCPLVTSLRLSFLGSVVLINQELGCGVMLMAGLWLPTSFNTFLSILITAAKHTEINK